MWSYRKASKGRHASMEISSVGMLLLQHKEKLQSHAILLALSIQIGSLPCFVVFYFHLRVLIQW